MFSIRLIAALAVCLLALPLSLSAVVIVDSNTALTIDKPVSFGSDGPWVLGWAFQVGPNPISVTHLGLFEEQVSLIDQQVAIFNGNSKGITPTGFVPFNGNGSIASATVSNCTGSAENFHCYTQLQSPVLLTAGGNYVIAGLFSEQQGNYAYNASSQVVGNGISYLGALSEEGDVLVKPTVDDSGFTSTGYHGPNFKYDIQAIPEPATFVLIGSGLALVALIRRRSVIR